MENCMENIMENIIAFKIIMITVIMDIEMMNLI